MKKAFEVMVEVFWDASNVETFVVKTNNEKNARKLALAKAKKKHKTTMLIVKSVKEQII